ncbi:MAG: pyridoxal kinase [Alphaproteobacteria bacterium]|nr:pyridoxal kinase [Alphaproteobacteria bacterium]
MRVISIQSQVVYGHVGNSAAALPMQAKGIEVAAVPTALLSNHPHYPTMYGQVLAAEFVEGLLRGVEERGLVEQTTAIVTGYLGSVENGEVIAEFVSRARAKNPDLIYVCDPVMGDDDLGLFVEEGLIGVFRDRLVSIASVITPNQYEIELLARTKARSAEGIAQAMHALSRYGVEAAVVTGCVLDDTPTGSVETVAWTPEHLTRTVTPRLPIRPCGTGDLFTALLLSRLCKGEPLWRASELATSEILAVLERTQKAGSAEMRLVGFPFASSHLLEPAG